MHGNSKQVHPDIKRVRDMHAPRLQRLRNCYEQAYTPPKPQEVVWQPKNPGIKWPNMNKERNLSQGEWQAMGFPHQPLPEEISGQVNTETWDKRILELKSSENTNQGLISLMEEISYQLKEGACSQVGYPGTIITHGNNYFQVPSRELPRVADALASFTAGGHVAGPLFDQDISQFKINPLMAVKKPGDHVRVVGNFKYPSGKSFNEGIPEESLADWQVTMLTAPQFAKKIIDAGRGAYMACSDLRDAYKMIPVSLKQRNLQAYRFCGALFVEMKLVFGDRMACSFFDRFHHAILQAFVYPASNFPPVAQGRTIDDIPSVVPKAAKEALVDFVQAYRSSLKKLNIRAAEDDPTHTKAFDCSTTGEVLGIRFNTEEFTWSLPHDKLYRLVSQVRELTKDNKKYSLRQLERVLGKLKYLAQLCPPLKNLISDATRLSASLICQLSDSSGNISDRQRDNEVFSLTSDIRQDLLMLAAVIADTFKHPLPILDPDPQPPLCAVQIYTDASGRIAEKSSPSLGIFFPPQDLKHAAAYSLPFPTDFLLSSNEGSLVANTTSTLEALGILIPMMVDPFRCVGKSLHIHIDNIAVVFSFKKRRSKDTLAHTIIRASFLLAGALACNLSVSWVRRRSERNSRIADDLTHSDFGSTHEMDRFATTRLYEAFPPPISRWMRDPCYDRDLGHRVISWMASYYDNLL